MSKMISKIGGTCRNIQGPGGVVFGEFFQLNLKVMRSFSENSAREYAFFMY